MRKVGQSNADRRGDYARDYNTHFIQFFLISYTYLINWCPGEEVLLRPSASTQHPAEQILRVIRLLSFGQLDQ